MKYPPIFPDERWFSVSTDGSILVRMREDGWWLEYDDLSDFIRKAVCCIAIVGWQREAVKLAVAGDQAQAEAAGANADAWLTILDELK